MNEVQRLALITGASGGIGEAIAEVLAADGLSLVIAARSEAELSRVQGVLGSKYSVPITVLPADLSQPGGCDRLAAALGERGFVPDIVINNAGFGLIGKAAILPREEQLNMIDLNVRAVADLTLRFLAGMVAK